MSSPIWIPILLSAALVTPAIETKASDTKAGETKAGETKAETPKAETPKAETPKAETPKAETPKAETPTAETPTADTKPSETPAGETATAGEIPAVGPVPEALRSERKLDPFYQKYLAVDGFPILGSSKVTDHALREAAWILRHVLAGRSDILRAMADRGVYLVVMAHDEYTTDVPEQRDMQPRVYWDRRARGLGGSPVSCAEENLLGYPGDPYSTENILIHEFAHAIHDFGLRSVDPTFDGRLRKAFEAAKERGLWKGTYAVGNRHEYWAEGVQSWFDDNRQNDALHNHVNTQAELEEYDPELARLCSEVFGKGEWRYHRPAERAAADLTHLSGFDRLKAPRFRWREEAISKTPRVLIQTELGDLELELDAARAPIPVKRRTSSISSTRASTRTGSSRGR